MKIRFSILSLVVFSVLLSTSPSAHAQLGIDAGVSFTSLENISSNPDDTFDNADGWHVGLSYLMGRRIGLRVGVRYMNVEGLYEGLSNQEPDGFDLAFVEVPLELRAAFGGRHIKPYILAGPLFRFPVSSSDEDFQDAVRSISYAGTVGAGIEIRLGGLGLLPEVNYVFGVSDFLDESFELGGANFSADGSGADSIILKLGVML